MDARPSLTRAAIFFAFVCVSGASATSTEASDATAPFVLEWANNILRIRRPANSREKLPGGEIQIHYLEAFCRPGSTDRDWGKTTIRHKTEIVEQSQNGERLRLRSRLADGVVVEHEIRGLSSAVEFRLTAHNPTKHESHAVWAQPCLRVDRFTGRTQNTYLAKCFIFVDGKLTRMPTRPWATQARYVPGQVWAPRNVNRNDVNPRPLSPIVPSNGLIGCFSADEKMILATAWEPYQEFFQGVITCVHSDFRIGGLKPGQTRQIRGKLYVVPADVSALVAQYRRDFPEHFLRAD